MEDRKIYSYIFRDWKLVQLQFTGKTGTDITEDRTFTFILTNCNFVMLLLLFYLFVRCYI